MALIAREMPTGLCQARPDAVEVITVSGGVYYRQRTS